jgi:manganese/zinc/iron transport system substrate-binding protein
MSKAEVGTGQSRPGTLTTYGLPLALCGFLLLGCNDQADKAAGQGPYRITCTVGMITDIVRNVAGDRAVVEGIMAEGVDPHLYKPTRDDVVKLQQADVVFYNGLMLEGKMADVLVKVARSGKPVFAVTEMLDDEQYVMTDPQQHYDPHVWMDVKGWILAVRAVAKALGEHDSGHAAQYQANAEKYIAELQKLDAYARQVIESIPKSQRVLVTAHDAFSYMGRAYGLEVRGIQGLSTESEAGVRDINELVDFLVQRKIGAVFVETSVADKNVRALVEGARSRGHDVKIGGSLFSDAMGKPGTYEGTYIGMIDHNVTTIARALGGQAPERGMNGKLGGTHEVNVQSSQL